MGIFITNNLAFSVQIGVSRKDSQLMKNFGVYCVGFLKSN